MADNLSIAVTADVTDLRAKMAIAGADVRAYRTEINQLGSAMRTASGQAKDAIEGHLQSVAGLLTTAESKMRSYRREMSEAIKPEGGGIAAMFSGAAEE